MFLYYTNVASIRYHPITRSLNPNRDQMSQLYALPLTKCGHLQSKHGEGSGTEDADSLGSLGGTTGELGG